MDSDERFKLLTKVKAWNARIVLGNNEISNTKEFLVLLNLLVEDENGKKEDIILELDKQEAQKWLANLKAEA